ncbi:hypothetical protein [Actinomycetospora atypica]|uniref:Glycosyltransferase RgtA/B/C/D-like domain-containing protein n=1 Tax=Actinomycetospora atypica TaxID=1290095 RepID=A0ABV9YKW7_9PSEU
MSDVDDGSRSAVRADGPGMSVSGVVAALGIPSAILIAHTAWYGEWIEDDAGLTFAYARSLSEGWGPVIQPGASPVEGWSNPTWLALMTFGRLVGLFDHGTIFGLSDLVVFPKFVAVLCGVAMFGAMFVLARAVSSRPVLVASVAGSATALVPSFVIWSTSGLENSLFALIVVSLATVLVRAAVGGRLGRRQVAILCGLLSAAAALTRPDGIVYVVAHPVVALAFAGRLGNGSAGRGGSGSVGRSIGHGIAAFSLPVGLYGIWRLDTFGDWLPTTARAKQQGLPTPLAVSRPGELVLYGGWLAFATLVVLLVLILRARSPQRTAVVVLLVPLGLAVLAYAVLQPDWMGQYRFATPVWALSALVGTLALEGVLDVAPDRRRRLILGGGIVVVLISLAGFAREAVAFRNDTTAPMCFVAQSVGQRIDAYADILGVRGGSLLAVDGGGTALSSRMRFIDLSGLTDRRIAAAWHDGDAAGLKNYVFDEVRPTFIKSARAWGGAVASGLLSDDRFQRDYVVLFAPEPGSGTWVRRDAIIDPGRVAVTRQWAQQAYRAVEQRYLRPEAQTQWRCGPTLTPASPSPYPLPARG